jgi:multiple sugar transport system permease protein
MTRVRAALHHLLVWGAAGLFLLPLVWAVITSLRPVGAPPPRTIEWWPADPQWANYSALFELVPMTRYLANSLLVVALAVPLTLLTASLAGFAMAQLPSPSQRRLLLFSVAVLMIPAASVWLARFQILRWLGLIDTIWALVAPAFAASSPLFVLLFYWTFRRLPAEMFEAARLEGASAVTAWWRLALPPAQPTAVAVLVLTFVLYWSDFISPVLYIYDTRWYTLPVGLQILKQLDATNWPLLMAGAVLMTLPVIMLFGGLQRFFLHDSSIARLFERD